VEIATIEEFLGYAVKVEEDAAIHYDELARQWKPAAIRTSPNCFTSSRIFAPSSSRSEVASGFNDVTKHLPPDYVWPDNATPRAYPLWAADPSASKWTRSGALQGERRGRILPDRRRKSQAAEIVKMARTCQGRTEHVKILQAWITEKNGSKHPVQLEIDLTCSDS